MPIDASHPVVTPEQGEMLRLGGLGVQYKIPPEVTAGAFAIIEHPLRPGVLVPPHLHTREDEYSFVIEGEVGIRLGDREFTAGPGDYVVKPMGVPHTFWNSGPGDTRLLEILRPPEFGRFFREASALLPEGGEPDFDRLAGLAERYGMSLLMDWVPELAARHGLTVLGL